MHKLFATNMCTLCFYIKYVDFVRHGTDTSWYSSHANTSSRSILQLAHIKYLRWHIMNPLIHFFSVAENFRIIPMTGNSVHAQGEQEHPCHSRSIRIVFTEIRYSSVATLYALICWNVAVHTCRMYKMLVQISHNLNAFGILEFYFSKLRIYW